jgi:hypothetical protein
MEGKYYWFLYTLILPQSRVKMSKPDSNLKNIKLILIGSCRNQEDQDRVDSLKQLAKVDFKLNLCELQKYHVTPRDIFVITRDIT